MFFNLTVYHIYPHIYICPSTTNRHARAIPSSRCTQSSPRQLLLLPVRGTLMIEVSVAPEHNTQLTIDTQWRALCSSCSSLSLRLISGTSTSCSSEMRAAARLSFDLGYMASATSYQAARESRSILVALVSACRSLQLSSIRSCGSNEPVYIH